MMPKMKKTKKHRRRTFPNIGRVSRSSITRILIPSGMKSALFDQIHNNLLGILFIARRGLSTLTVLMADRFNFSTSRQYSRALCK